jgi:hypothetical protein
LTPAARDTLSPAIANRLELQAISVGNSDAFKVGMTSEMNVLLEKLQEAIDQAISDSSRINGIVEEMKRSGYDTCLILESSVAISPIEETSVPDPRPVSTGEIELTPADVEFLQELNIAL